MWPANMTRGRPPGFRVAKELPATSARTSSASGSASARQTRAGAASKAEGPGVSSRDLRKASDSGVMAALSEGQSREAFVVYPARSSSSQESGTGYGIVPVRRDLLEAEREIETLRRAHRGQGVEPHAPVARVARLAHGPLGQPAAPAAPARRRPHVETLHLRDAGLERAEGDAAHRLAALESEQETAGRADVFARAGRPAPPRSPGSRGRPRARRRTPRRGLSRSRAFPESRPRGSAAAYHILPEGVDLGEPERHRARSGRSCPEARPQELGAIHDAWTRARGVGVAVEDPRRHRTERRERCRVRERRQLGQGALQSKAAQHDDDQVGPQLIAAPCHCRRAEWSPGVGTHIGTARGLHQLGHPVAGEVERLQPLDADDPRPSCDRPIPEPSQAAPRARRRDRHPRRSGRALPPRRGCRP